MQDFVRPSRVARVDLKDRTLGESREQGPPPHPKPKIIQNPMSPQTGVPFLRVSKANQEESRCAILGGCNLKKMHPNGDVSKLGEPQVGGYSSGFPVKPAKIPCIPPKSNQLMLWPRGLSPRQAFMRMLPGPAPADSYWALEAVCRPRGFSRAEKCQVTPVVLVVPSHPVP